MNALIVGASVGSKNSTMSAPVTVWPARSEISGIRTFRKPSGPISQASGSRICLIELRIGLANFEMNEPRSSVMSPKTTCGEETAKPSAVLQRRPKSMRIFIETDGRMFAKSEPRLLKSTTASARRSAPPSIATLTMSLRLLPKRSLSVSSPGWPLQPCGFGFTAGFVQAGGGGGARGLVVAKAAEGGGVGLLLFGTILVGGAGVFLSPAGGGTVSPRSL